MELIHPCLRPTLQGALRHSYRSYMVPSIAEILKLAYWSDEKTFTNIIIALSPLILNEAGFFSAFYHTALNSA